MNETDGAENLPGSGLVTGIAQEEAALGWVIYNQDPAARTDWVVVSDGPTDSMPVLQVTASHPGTRLFRNLVAPVSVATQVSGWQRVAAGAVLAGAGAGAATTDSLRFGSGSGWQQFSLPAVPPADQVVFYTALPGTTFSVYDVGIDRSGLHSPTDGAGGLNSQIIATARARFTALANKPVTPSVAPAGVLMPQQQPFARPSLPSGSADSGPIQAMPALSGSAFSLSIDPPASVQGHEPGTPVIIKGTYQFRKDIQPVDAQVVLTIDGVTSGPVDPVDADRWEVPARVYRTGDLPVVCAMTATDAYTGSIMQAEGTATVTVSSLQSAVPAFTVDTPQSNDSVPIGLAGGGFALAVTTAADFGPRSLTWSFEDASTANSPTRFDWQGRVAVSVAAKNLPLGPQNLQVSVFCDEHPQVSQTVQIPVNIRDFTGPALRVTQPNQNQTIRVATLTGATITITGTASDTQSGMGGPAKVEVSLTGRDTDYTAASTSDGWANWTITVPLIDYGAYTAQVRAFDAAGNRTNTTAPFQIVSTYQPGSLAERLDDRSYLDALLTFGHDQVRAADGSQVSGHTLETVFSQPFEALAQPLAGAATAATDAVNELRPTIELIRRLQPRLLAADWAFTPPGLTKTVPDLSGWGQTLTLQANASIRLAGPNGEPVLSVDGSNTGFASTAGDVAGLGDHGAGYSIVFDYYPQSPVSGKPRVLLTKFTKEPQGVFAIWLGEADNTLHFLAGTGSVGQVSTSQPLPLNQWSHIVCICDAEEVRIYLNGVLAGRESYDPVPDFQKTDQSSFYLGWIPDPKATGAAGLYGRVRIYELPLSDDTIPRLATGTDTQPPSALTDAATTGMQGYRQSAYQSLLEAIGTSYAELRLAAGADDATRSSLASRLGIDLTGNPDQLTQLTILPITAVTEAGLETLFGLPSTDPGLDPLRARTTPLLQQWRETAMTARWVAQDQDATTRPLPVILDPDLLSPADLTEQAATGQTGQILAARQQQVLDWATQLHALHTTSDKAALQFGAMLLYALPADITLDAIGQHLREGVNIANDLKSAQLTLPAFRTLSQIQQLCNAGTVTDDEWTTAEQILTQVLKVGQHDTWHTQEQGISVCPALFHPSDSPPTLIPWRAAPIDRTAWENLLQSRLNEVGADRDGHSALLAGVEQRVLPLLRDTLVAAIAGREVAHDASERLTRSLAVNLQASGAQETTRITAATDTLQTILFSTRSGLWPPGHPASGWSVTDTDKFDQQWSWLGDSNAWATAATAFLYPESWLDPTLRTDPSPAFQQLVRATRAAPNLDAAGARALAAQFQATQRAEYEGPASHGFVNNPQVALLFTDSSGAVAVDSVTRWTGKLNGNVAWTDGLFGPAAQFNKPNAAIDFDVTVQGAPPDISQNFTISFWAFPTAPIVINAPGGNITAGLTGQCYAYGPLQASGYGTDHVGAGVSVGTNGVSVYEHGDKYLAPVVSYSLDISDWTHIAVVYRNRTPWLYINGRNVATGNPSPKTVHALPQSLGNAYGYGQYLGMLQQVRVYNRQLLDPDETDVLAFRLTDQLDDASLDRLAAMESRILTNLCNPTPPYVQAAGAVFTELFYFVPLLLAQRLQAAGEFLAALDWWRTIYAYHRPRLRRFIYYPLSLESNTAAKLQLTGDWAAHLNPHAIAATRPNAYTRFTLQSLGRCFSDYGASEFAKDTSETLDQARTLYETAAEILNTPALGLPVRSPTDDVAFPNPFLAGLQQKVRLQLTKLRLSRYITGEPRTLVTDIAQVISAGPPVQATPYHFRTLLDRAKQLVALAQQTESAYLHALEQYDDRSYRRFEAQNGIDVAAQQVLLQQDKQTQAQDGIGLARRQKTRADLQAAQMTAHIAAGLNIYEQSMLSDIWWANSLKDFIGGLDAAITVATFAQQTAGFEAVFKSVPAIVGSGAALGKAVFTGLLDQAEAQLQADQLMASHENQVQSWQDTLQLAQQDSLIGDSQIAIADDQLTIATQESAISQLQLRQTQTTLNFLDRQFTNADLYQYMSGVLGEVYAFLLQEAAAVGRQAQSQLAFERQMPVPTLVQSNYWTDAGGQLAAAGAKQAAPTPNLRGLTGAERLLQDLATLEQFSFNNDQRRLNLTQTFSLASLLPLPFTIFRQTGVLDFATLPDWFDRAFPGHYLRLIQQVRVSVIALIPPDLGIRATMSDSGISRVVTGGDTFSEVVIRRTPETVALTSPAGATGVFALDTQSEMLQPFQSRGVVTGWRLEMPLPANPFDYGSIADVLLSFDYTALADPAYRDQVVRGLNTARLSADRMISIRQDRIDAWYTLITPPDPTAAHTATFSLNTSDFASSLTDLPRVADISVYLPTNPSDPASAQGAAGAPFRITLRHNGRGGQGQASDGVIGTRRGNAPAWESIRNTPAAGDWTVTVDAADAAALLDGTLQDIVLIISYTGTVPTWSL
ncbi:LamG-like jellyroll fold domain-containing protein [Arthrobacter sp. efr-133-TYG-118]|uniref:Tc toxin subunit A-related protein n=1 Tax=Arthrobacter sp. efr-133-TYG-118 TaxID=3040279 RepID=UPI00254C821A|nr:LamG-like jellyroll fold domain-containing protein [Arthrobacter sp. efr-133-TYG-118]